MAVIQYTALVAGMQGKLNGSVLSRGRAGNVLYNRPKQRLQPTSSQLDIRAAFSAIAAAWRELTSLQRTEWAEIADLNPIPDRYGDPQILSGYAYFQRMLLLGSPQIPPAPLFPNTVPDSVYEFETVSSEMTIERTDQGFLITDLLAIGSTLNNSPTTNAWNIYISLPIPDFGPPYFKTWYLIGQGTFPGNLGTAAQLEYEVPEKLLPSGFRTFNNSKHYLKAVNYIQNQGGVSVEHTWDIEAVLDPVVVFPFFGAPINDRVISFDGPSGLFGYYWSCTQGILIRTNFTIQTMFAPPQNSMAPVPEMAWVDLVPTGFTGIGGELAIVPANPPAAANWYQRWYDAVGVAWTPAFGFYAPVRARLVDIATSEEGPWEIAFWEIQLV